MGVGLEIGLTVGAIALAAVVLLVWALWASPREDIPDEYFFQVRAPKVVKRRQLEAKAKKKEVVEI